MRFIPNTVSSTVARGILKSEKASPKLLFAAGIVSMGATVVLSCRATLKVDKILDETQQKLADINLMEHDNVVENYSTTDARKDRAVILLRATGDLTKLYGPAILCGVVSVSALTQSHNILSKRNAALAAAYGTIEKAFNEYRDRVRESIGEDKERDLYYGLEPCEVDDEAHPNKKKIALRATEGLKSPYARFFSRDTAGGSFSTTPEYNLLFLRAQQNYANDQLQSRGHVTLNDVYDGLGLERTSAGAVVGWLKNSKDGDNYIDFGALDGNNQEAFYDFMCGDEGGIWLDFNVDGIIYDKI